ncbi:hypothetical protein ACFYO2_49035 [Streptomyces sp. NPDC006602]|uniref:hypothetical protein n=1 Tax=Streptomyces sp. NPDC006602 TaxID=3364751 RepID=UPI0036792273
MSDGGGFSGTSTPHFEDTGAATLSPIIIAAELLAGMTPVGAAARVALMTLGVGVEVYESVEHFGEGAESPAGSVTPHVAQEKSRQSGPYRVMSTDWRGIVERRGDAGWRVTSPQVRNWGTRDVAELPESVNEVDLARGRVMSLNITSFEPVDDFGGDLGRDTGPTGPVFDIGRGELNFGGFDDLSGGLGKLG